MESISEVAVETALDPNDGNSSGSDIVPVRNRTRPLEDSSDDDLETAERSDQVCQENQPLGDQSMEIQLLGDQSIFSVFRVDESLLCSSPMEKHLYEVLPPSVTSSPPCYYCGETDLVRTSVESENTYPLCHFCRTVKKFGPVLKRKRRTIVPRKQKPKNKKRKAAVELLDEDDHDMGESTLDENENIYETDSEEFFEGDFPNEVPSYQNWSEGVSIEEEELYESGLEGSEEVDHENHSEVTQADDETIPSLPPSPIRIEWTYSIPVEELLGGSEEED